jgi:hypothetical protein
MPCLLSAAALLYLVGMLALLWWTHRSAMRSLDAAEADWRESFRPDHDGGL